MNNRKRNRAAARRKADLSRRRDLHKLFDLVLDINGVDYRKREITEDLPTVFFSFSGHTASAEVRIHDQGWYSYADVDHEYNVWRHDPVGPVIKELGKLAKDLRDRDYEQP